MFDELFIPRYEASESTQLQRAREQAKIYGHLFPGQNSPDAIFQQIVDEVKNNK